MKKIIIIIFIAIVAFSCENQENVFPDYPYNSVYFPAQWPVRTLVLGEYRIENSNDNQGIFEIGVSMGGVYENKEDRIIGYEQRNELLDSLYIGGRKALPLPSSYIESFQSSGTVTIPAGDFSGYIPIDLNENFFNDPLALNNNYYLPLIITDKGSIDSLLSGVALLDTADRRIDGEWDTEALPKDFTICCIKYVNEYDGDYLLRGAEELFDLTSGTSLDSTTEYREKYNVMDKEVILVSNGRSSVTVSYIGSRIGSMQLAVDGSNNVTVSGVEGQTFQPASIGSENMYYTSETSVEEWGEIIRPAFYLEYEYADSANNILYRAKDTLVFRNRNVVLELTELSDIEIRY